jgi:hypothetical protein
VKTALLAAWSAVILAVYLLAPAHRFVAAELAAFFNPGPLLAQSLAGELLQKMSDAFAFLLVGASILGAGTLAARIISGRTGPVRAFFLGLAPAALFGLGLGLVGLWEKGVLASAAALGAASLLVHRPKFSLPSRGLLFALLPCLICLPGALVPEYAFDSVRYHLALPGLYLHEHKIFHVGRFLFSGFPSSMEMLYGFCLATGSEGTAKLLNWSFLPLSGTILYGLLALLLSGPLAVLLTASFCSMPFMGSLAVFSNVDLPMMAVEFMALACIWKSLASPGQGRWFSAGWLFGTAMGMKYLGLYAFAGALFAIPLAGLAPLRPLLTRAFPFAFGLPLAWLAKNFFLTGNPVFPYLGKFFGTFDIEAETIRRHLAYAADWASGHPAWSAWAQVFPVALAKGTYDGLTEALSPVIFLLPALAVLSFPPRGPRRWLLFFCAILWTIWATAGGGIFRFLVPFYPASFLLAGALAAGAGLATRPVAAILGLSLLAQLPILITSQYRLGFAPMGSATGFEARGIFLDRVLPPARRYFTAIRQGVRTARPGTLLVLGDPKSYYAPGRCRTEFEFAPPLLLHLSATSDSPRRIRLRLRQAGITAALYRAEAAVSQSRMCDCIPVTTGTLELYQRFWEEYMEPAWVEEYPKENNYYQCYRVREKPGKLALLNSDLWFNLPGTEILTSDADHALVAGNRKEAATMARQTAARHPNFAPALYRVVLCSPGTAEASRAKKRMAELGWGELGR